jgi:SAM-dependent methyltransferase
MARMSDDRAYLEAIRALTFEDRSWTPAAIEDMRDFLSPWNHNLRLAPGVYTAYYEDFYAEHQTIMEVIEDHLHGRFEGTKLLDLGCLEGFFSLECALRGADVVGVDAKEINVKKCEFARSVLDARSASFVLDDVMNVTRTRYGGFDVVLALGLLYHLDDPFSFLTQIAEVCDGFLLLDTLVALEDGPQVIDGWEPELSELQEFSVGTKNYRGRLYREYQAGASDEERALSTTAAHKNDLAVWLLEDSLRELLQDAGFGRLERLVFARSEDNWWSDPRDGRVLYLARKPKSFSSRIFGS